MRNDKQVEDMIQNWRIRRLFRAVLERAARDAFLMKTKSLSQRKKRYEAICFFNNEVDLKMICALADADYEAIIKAFRENKITKKDKYKKIILGIFNKVSLFY